MGQLNELQIKAAAPREKEYLLTDGEGLYLRVRPTGKVWVYRYKQRGKEAKLSIGHYPVVTLAAARKKARAEAEKRADGVDPREAQRLEEERDRVARLNTFELTARAWHAQVRKDREWSASYAEKVMRHLELHIFPWIGALAMEAIVPTEVVRCLHRIKERGNLETALRGSSDMLGYRDVVLANPQKIDDPAFRSVLFAAIDRLPQDQKQVIGLLLKGIPIDAKEEDVMTIARILQCDERTVRNRRDRACKALKAILEEEAGRVGEVILWQLRRAGSFSIGNEGAGSRFAHPVLRVCLDA